MLSNRATLESYAFANPHNNSVTVTQAAGGIALDPHDSRLTQVSSLDGMLWTGGGPQQLSSASPDTRACHAGIICKLVMSRATDAEVQGAGAGV